VKKRSVKTRFLISLAIIASLAQPPARSLAAVDLPSEQMVNFSFDQADLRLIIKIVGEMTGRRFVIDEKVKGNITVVTPDNVSLKDVYPLLLSILESSGFSVIEKPGGIHVVPLPEAGRSAGRMIGGDEMSGEGLITKLIRINHISAIELAKLLEPMVRGGSTGAVSAFGATNHLIITDTAESIRQIEKLIRDLDTAGTSKTMEVIRLKYANPDELASQLYGAMQGAETSSEQVGKHIQRIGAGLGSLPANLVVVPVRNANSIVVVGTPVQLNQIREIIEKIDIETPVEFGRLNLIFLKYMKAEEAATTLNNLLAKTAAKDAAARISIEHNTANNALLVEAAPQDFELVRKVIDDLDRMPQQVVVEVMIAEVSLGEGLDLGVEWNSIEAYEEGQNTVVGRSRPGETDGLASILETGTFPQGLSIGVARGTYSDAAGRVLPRVPFMVQALAKNRDVKILSNVPLMSQNNSEASLKVVEEIPILKSSVQGTAAVNRDYLEKNIEREEYGIKLTVTPQVNADNEVRMNLITSIDAVIDPGPADTPFTPTVAIREVKTTVTVPDRATVIISGLIREDQIKEVSKVPFLGDIPFLGWFFRSTKDRVQRTNLLIFVTPHIVKNMNDAEAVKAALESRTSMNPTSALPVIVEAEVAP
jgi:general secretion pathway protein D